MSYPSNVTYTYRPLESSTTSFRLVTLRPGNRSDTIQCVLGVYDLSEPLVYEALSYEWGEPGGQHFIELDGQSFQVGYNLCQCLQKLRPTMAEGPRLLFVDAICIDQKNIPERNDQVKIMGAIYKSAHIVHAWIGDAEDDSGRLLLVASAAYDTAQAQRPDGDPFVHLQVYKAVAESDPPLEAALSALFWRSYWSRLWIIQEVLLACQVTVHCGGDSVSFDLLNHLFAIYVNISDTEFDTAVNLRQAYRQTGGPAFWQDNVTDGQVASIMSLRESDEAGDLSSLLGQFDCAKCKDPRDMVYGLLGLANDYDGTTTALQPDYGCELESLFFDVLSFCKSPRSVEFASILLDSLQLRPALGQLRENAKKKEASAGRPPERSHTVAVFFVGTLELESSLEGPLDYPGKSPGVTLRSYTLDLHSRENRSDRYLHFSQRAVFLVSKKVYVTSFPALQGDRIFWMPQTRFAVAYRRAPSATAADLTADEAEWHPVGCGLISTAQHLDNFAQYSSLDLDFPALQSEDTPFSMCSITDRDLLDLLQEERVLDSSEYEAERYWFGVHAMAVEAVASEGEAPDQEREPEDESAAQIRELNDLFRDRKTLAMTDAYLNARDGGGT